MNLALGVFENTMFDSQKIDIVLLLTSNDDDEDNEDELGDLLKNIKIDVIKLMDRQMTSFQNKHQSMEMYKSQVEKLTE